MTNEYKEESNQKPVLSTIGPIPNPNSNPQVNWSTSKSNTPADPIQILWYIYIQISESDRQ